VTLTEAFLRLWKRAIGEQPHAGNDRRGPTEEQTERQMEVLRTLVANVDALVTEQRSGSKQQHDDSQDNRRIARAVLIVTAIYAGLTLLMWSEMRKTTHEARRTADAATAQSKAALDANEITRQEQRAWLFPVLEEDPKFDFANLAVIKLGMQNSGRSLATNVKFRILMLDFDGVPDKLPGIKESWTQTAVVVPNGTRTINLGLVPPAMQTLIATNKKKLIVWSYGAYTDRFNTAGEWYICRMYDHWLKRFSHCPENKTWGPDRAK
jgi:hypothetical protein